MNIPAFAPSFLFTESGSRLPSVDSVDSFGSVATPLTGRCGVRCLHHPARAQPRHRVRPRVIHTAGSTEYNEVLFRRELAQQGQGPLTGR
eukprot:6970493-Prymnesium_polylepis.1